MRLIGKTGHLHEHFASAEDLEVLSAYTAKANLKNKSETRKLYLIDGERTQI